MQLNMINTYRNLQVGNHNPAAWMRGKTQQTAKAQDVFGAQCKVTISREGRKLSKEDQDGVRSFSAGSAERLLLRAQEQKENEQKEHTSLLDEISGLMSDIQNSYESGADKETTAKKQEALQRLIDLKARQEEENKQCAEYASGSAAAASKGQEEIDQKNADLYMMLKSFEEQDEDEESAGEGTADNAQTTDEDQKLGSVGEQFDHAASQLGVSAAKREMQATAAIDELMNDGYDRIAKADGMIREAQEEIGLAMEAAGKEHLSEAERRELVSGHLESARGMIKSNYSEIMRLRRTGIQETKDARELELEHIQLNPLEGVDRVKQSILDSGVDAALNEVSQGTIEKASNELEQRVQDLLDKRNDITSDADESEETQELEEKTEEVITKQEDEENAGESSLLETKGTGTAKLL